MTQKDIPIPGSAPETLTITSLLVNFNVANELLDAGLFENALLDKICHAPRQIFHFCPRILPSEDALSDLENNSRIEARADLMEKPNALAEPDDLEEIRGIMQNPLKILI